MPDEYGNETPKERRERIRRERQEHIDKVNEAERKRRQEKQEEAAWEAAEREAGERLDEGWFTELEDYFGAELNEIEDDISKYGDATDEDIKKAMEAIQKGKQQAKDGVFFKGDKKGAKRTIRKNKEVIKKAHKKAKAKKGCSLFALGLLAGFGGVLYSMYEVGSAIASAIF